MHSSLIVPRLPLQVSHLHMISTASIYSYTDTHSAATIQGPFETYMSSKQLIPLTLWKFCHCAVLGDAAPNRDRVRGRVWEVVEELLDGGGRIGVYDGE